VKFVPLDDYQIPGYTLRVLTPADRSLMQDLRQAVMEALPNPRWYFSMEDWVIDEWLSQSSAVGYLADGVLAGFGAITPWHQRPGHHYAGVLGEPEQDTYDFHDVMVHPAHRGHRMHQQLLKLFTASVNALNGRAVYATVDPENSASWYNFEKEGYVCLLTQPAYDGRDRRYYRLALHR